MSVLGCLWNRSRLDAYVDGALGDRPARSVSRHVARCTRCSGYVERGMDLRRVVRTAATEPAEPDWATFWPGISARIAREKPRPIKDPWWIPLWAPFWGHPRLAVGGLVAAGLALTLTIWPASNNSGSAAWAMPVVVQDVSTPDPEGSVMVYSTPDQALTVIWVFSPSTATEES